MENVMTNNAQEAMPNTTVDINDVSAMDTTTELESEVLSVDLVCGTGVSIDINSMDWGDLYNRINEMDSNIVTLKSMIYDLTHMAYTTDEEKGARNNASDSAFTTASEFLRSMGMPETIDYNFRADITSYEKALLAAMDAILILEAIIHEARVQALMKVDTSSMIDQILENIPDITIDDSNINEILEAAKTQTEASPLPVMNETNEEG